MSVDIANEDDLLLEVGKRFRSYYREMYPKITRMSRNIQVIPDIDLLEINSRESPATIIGYEMKLLKYRKNWNRIPYEPLYTGLGEALCYYQYGIDQVYLVLGFHSNIPHKARDRFLDRLQETMGVWMIILKDYVGLTLWNPHKNIINPSSKFPVNSDEDLKYKRSCLLRKEFVYNKKLYRTILEE